MTVDKDSRSSPKYNPYFPQRNMENQETYFYGNKKTLALNMGKL